MPRKNPTTSRKTRVRKAANKYYRSWAIKACDLDQIRLQFRIEYAFTQGADHERRHNFRHGVKGKLRRVRRVPKSND